MKQKARCKMTKTLTQDVFKGAPDWVRSAVVDENGHAFMNNYPKSDLYIGQITGIGAHLILGLFLLINNTLFIMLHLRF